MGEHKSFSRFAACKGAAVLLAWAALTIGPAQAGDGGLGLMIAHGNMSQSFTAAQQFIAQNRFSSLNPAFADQPLFAKDTGNPISYSDELAARLGIHSGGMNLMELPPLMGNSLGVNLGAGGEPGLRGPMLNLKWRFGQ